MSDHDQKPPLLMPRARRRFLEAAERIRLNQPTFDDLAYMARELVQVTLPHPRRRARLVAQQRQSDDDRPAGLGSPKAEAIRLSLWLIPRLLLFWLTAEAVQKRNRQIELGSSLSDFMFQLGLNPATGRGPRGDARRLREQMQRLFNAVISFDHTTMQEGRQGEGRINMTVASRVMLWWSPRDPSQAALWGSWVELSKEFFNAITANPVPLDMRALKALKRSPLALDLYAWLSYEAFHAHKTSKVRFVAWKLLAEQMGTDYAEVTDSNRRPASPSEKSRPSIRPSSSGRCAAVSVSTRIASPPLRRVRRRRPLTSSRRVGRPGRPKVIPMKWYRSAEPRITSPSSTYTDETVQPRGDETVQLPLAITFRAFC